MTNELNQITMKQPDTAALRERLTSFTPERELEENIQKHERLLQETDRMIDVTREMLQEISAAKKEIQSIHMDLMHTSDRSGMSAKTCQWLRKVRITSRTKSVEQLLIPCEILSSKPSSTRENWRNYKNIQPPTSRPRKNCWKVTE